MRLPAKIAFTTAILFCLHIPCVKSEEVTRTVLKNGLVVLVQETHDVPLTAIEAQIRAGSATEYGHLGSGISHYVEHMLFKGTKNWPAPGDIEREIKSLGGYINAYTDHDATDVHIVVPSESTSRALAVLKDMISEVTFDPAELEKERDVILKEIRLGNDEPAGFVSRLLWSTMFKTHNYRFPTIGQEEIFKNLKREDLIDYYRTNYVPDNMVLGVAGDIKKPEALEEIEKIFGSIERLSPPPQYLQKEGPQMAQMSLRAKKDVAFTYLTLGFRSVNTRNKDMFGLDVLSIILGTGGSSRLHKKLYMDEKLVTSVSSYNYTPKDPGIFAISATLKSENTDKALEEIWGQIEDIKTRPVSDAELQKAKNLVLSDYVFSRQTIENKLSDLINGETITGDYDFSKKYVEGINAVTKETVMSAAKKYLTKENSTLILLAPDKAAAKKEGQPPAAGDTVKIERFKLDNGLRALIFEDHKLPIVSMDILGLGGTRSETFADNGISNLTADTLLCGTTTRTEEQILTQTETAGGFVGSFATSNNFAVSGSGLSKDWGLLLDICADAVKNPVFPEDKLRREKTIIKERIKRVNDDIYALGIRTLKYTLFRNHPYRFSALGRPYAIDRLSQKDIRDYYASHYTAGNMVLAVSGDIDPKAVKEKITGLFGKLAKRQPVKIGPAREKKKTQPRILTRTASKEQSVIMLGYLGAESYSHDKYVLNVLASVLSGINGRLSKSIREEKGLAYVLNAVSLPGLERGMFILYVGTSRENLDAAKNELFKEIGLIKKDGITNEELLSAKKELAGAHKMWLQKIQDVASKAATDELSGADYLNYTKFEDRINRITKECVSRAARKYLDDYSYVLLTVKGK